jgi:pilus assembly protein FimV
MRRYLPRLVLTGALLSPMSVWALGLGEIRLNSSLNQPFDAEIELISPTAEELQSLKVGLAGNDVFARLNIDRPSFLSGFDFSITRTRDGGAAIRVRSSRSVTEPFVTLLVEASWARGRLVREYTVLLDPPVFAPSQGAPAAPLATPQSGARSEGVVERPAPQPAPAPQEPVASAPTPPPAAAPAPRPAPSASGDYTVQRNDTLWRIASRVNPGSPAVVNQTMIALYRANPQAFDGNINRLRAGSVLRIPDLAEIETISTREAAAEVARQTSEWTGALQADSSADVSRLRLVTPQEALTPSTTTSPAETPATSQQESSAASTGGASEQDRRLQVENPALAGVQQSADPAAAESPVAEEPAAAAESEAGTETETPTQTKPVQKPRTAPAATDTSSEPSLLDRVREFWWVAVILGLLGLLLVFLRRRRTDTSEFDAAEPSEPASFDYEPPARRTPSVAPAQEEPFLGAADADDDFDAVPQPAVREEAPQTRPIEPVAAFQERSIDDTLSSDTAIRLDQQDALAEADFHMAYGLYDQAADLVKIAISRDPARRDLKLKLLEIYFVWGNKDLFLETARELHATRDAAAPGEWDKILIMGKQIAPSDPLFEGETASLSDLVDVNLEGGENRVDVDLFAEPEPEPEQAGGLDLDLAATGEHLAATPSTDGELDFLLDETQHADAIEATREFDPLARTQETPTIESPMLDRADSTIRERADTSAFASLSADQTAEISLDDLGLDTEALDHSGALEETTSLDKDGEGDTIENARPLRDDEMTQLAPSLGSADRTMMAPRAERFDPESTGTIYLDEAELSAPAEVAGVGDTVEQPRATDIDSTAAMKLPDDLEFDVSGLEADASEGSDEARADSEQDFSNAVFGGTSDTAIIDLDVGDSFAADDASPTNKQEVTNEMELSELEPVTMSEVGTKLDLARAYMDMGDPDGARSILEEVLQEGSPNQKQEANRLLESIR